MPIFLDQLNDLVKLFPRKKYELASRLGITREHLSKVLGGHKAGSQLVVAVELLHKEHFSRPAQEKANASAPFMKREVFTRKIPVVSWAHAGCGSDYEDLCRQMQEQIDTDNRDPNAYAIIIEGDSMEPDFRAGDIVTFCPNQFPRPGDYVVARLEETGDALFKKYRLTGREGQTVVLESLNPLYAPREFPLTAFRFIHPAWDVKRRFRR